MSQSAVLYRISETSFKELKRSEQKCVFDIPSISKSNTVFEGSFMALEFILSKGQHDTETIKLIREIFNPTKHICDKELSNLSPEEYFELFESGEFISYLDLLTVSKISSILETYSKQDLQSRYDANELNKSGIYPQIWHNDNSQGYVYNLSHISDDFNELKIIFKQAAVAHDYILIFVG